MDKKIGFIGCGNMGQAILKGMLKSGQVLPENMIVSAKSDETVNKLKTKYGVWGTHDNIQVAKEADILFLGVKPYLYSQIITEIKDHVQDETLVIGMAAGVSTGNMEELFEKPLKIVKIMPNTPVAVGEGVIALVTTSKVEDQEKEAIITLLKPLGLVKVINESHMDVITGISGSSPAYVYMFIEAMADAAVKNGFPRKDAYEISAQAVLGGAKMVLETGIHPGVLKDQVTSPGGTTIEAVVKLEELGLRHTVISAVDTCIEKSKKMGK